MNNDFIEFASFLAFVVVFTDSIASLFSESRNASFVIQIGVFFVSSKYNLQLITENCPGKFDLKSQEISAKKNCPK